MIVLELQTALGAIAPTQHAADWDNVGLLVGRWDANCDRALLCIDLTQDVLREAIEQQVQVVIAYHPVVFEPIKSVTLGDPNGDILLGLIEAGIAVICPHTALDAAPNGMTDWLAQGIGKGTTTPIQHADADRPGEDYKLVINVPRDSVDAVRDAAAAAGAGRIGNYDTCSAMAEIIGTFRPGKGSEPVLGEAGKVETVEEYRLSTVCCQMRLAAVLEAIRQAHPYEEPPIHIIALEDHPLPNHGEGRILTLDEPASTATIIDRLKTHLNVPSLRLVQGDDDMHSVVGCCPGAGGSMIDAASVMGDTTLFVTGEMRHHDLLKAKARGMSVLLAGHTHTERGFLPHLAARLAAACPSMTFQVSKADEAPWTQI